MIYIIDLNQNLKKYISFSNKNFAWFDVNIKTRIMYCKRSPLPVIVTESVAYTKITNYNKLIKWNI